MKCALIFPAWTPQELFPRETAGSQINYWQPLGVLYIAAMLLKTGHEVRFFNGAFLRHEEIMRRVADFNPGFAAIYSVTFGWYKAKHMAESLKRLNPDIFTCVGGPYAIGVQERCLHECAFLDAVGTGEGEYTIPEMLERIESGRSLAGVLGIAFRRGAEIIKNPPRPLIEDLDSLPFPAREILDEREPYRSPLGTYRREPVTVMMTSRGCRRRCIFCFQIDRERKSGLRGERFRSIENVLAEIELCLRQGYREIKFLDESFSADYDRAMQLCQAIRARRLDFTWFASACVNMVDRPLLQAMKDAGCWAILMGGESGAQEHLNTLRKGETLAQMRAAVRAAKDVGLTVSMPFVFGVPGETFEDGLKTIEFALEIDPDLANFHCLTPFPGTYLYEHREKYGTVSENLLDYTYQGAAFVPYTMTREQIQALRQLAFRRFYSRPAFLVRQLFRLRNLNDLRAAAAGLKSLFWLWVRHGLFQRLQRRKERERSAAATAAAARTPAPAPGSSAD